MKLLLIIIPAFFFFTAAGQTPMNEVPKEKLDELNRALKERFDKQPWQFRNSTDTFHFNYGNNVKLPEPGVYALPQDNMPCIVPDQKALVQMPNVMKPRLPFNSRIPNAAPLNRMPNKKAKPSQKKWVPVFISDEPGK